ncbi:MAG: hypothetical protein HGN29_15630 [Asgard group archaeon]|nr:hypothetical protein [Asgard group archaeon]
MFVLDSFVFGPIIHEVWYVMTFSSDYLFGMMMGMIAGGIMVIVGFLTLLLRHIIEKKWLANKTSDSNNQ